MLLSFRAANHRSLRGEQQLLLTPAYPAEESKDTGWDAVPVVGIFGPNASGKSNVLDALAYMRRLVRGSLRESEPGSGVIRHPFALDAEASDEASSFVVDLQQDGIRYEYGFQVDGTRVVEEWMYSYPHRQRRREFHRTGDHYEWGSHSPASLRQVADIVDLNVLFLSVAARTRQEEVRPVYDWFLGQGDIVRPKLGLPGRGIVEDSPDDSGGYLDRLTKLLAAADTGIDGNEVGEEEEFSRRRIGLYLRTRGKEDMRPVQFLHKGVERTYPLRLVQESNGTRALMELSQPVFDALDAGTVLMIDEIDSSLHPYVSSHLVGLFRDPETNPRGAQLIFSSHDPSLLGRVRGREVLRRDHIWFTEKDECGRTELFPLTDFHPRNDENHQLRYMAGRYGAVPSISDELLVSAVRRRESGPDVAEES